MNRMSRKSYWKICRRIAPDWGAKTAEASAVSNWRRLIWTGDAEPFQPES